jgi:drug/metabolite transporter (DMT)-like permease
MKKQLWLGIAWAVFTIFLWASWQIATRFGVTRSMSVFDLVAVRFAVAALVMLPIVLRQGLAVRRLGLGTVLVLAATAGAPYVLVAAGGLSLAPAGQGGALIAGVLPLWVTLLGAVFLGERPSRWHGVGLALIFLGAAAIVGVEGIGQSSSQLFGQILLLSASAMYAIYSLVNRRAGLSSLHATAIVSVLSAAFYLPVYVLFLHPTLFEASLQSVLFQAVYQGAIVSLLALIGWNRALALLGPARLAPFASLVPVLTLLAAIPILGEVPTPIEWAGTILISLGVPLASGALGRRAASKASI